MSPELEAQHEFAHDVALLLQEAERLGFRVSLGEAWRPPDLQKLYVEQGKSWTMNSRHLARRAIDLNLFKGGVFMEGSEAHRELGEWWEKQHPLARWGGRFKTPDGNHYSLEYGGMK